MEEEILAIIEGEDEKTLAEIHSLLVHHMAYRAGQVSGDKKFSEIIEEGKNNDN